MDSDNSLSHYGVKGMRWGKRKAVSPSSDYKSTAKLRNKNPATLSDIQLQKINKRIEMEKKYKQLNPSQAKRGQQFMKEAVGTATLALTVYNIVKSPAFKLVLDKGKTALFNN